MEKRRDFWAHTCSCSPARPIAHSPTQGRLDLPDTHAHRSSTPQISIFHQTHTLHSSRSTPRLSHTLQPLSLHISRLQSFHSAQQLRNSPNSSSLGAGIADLKEQRAKISESPTITFSSPCSVWHVHPRFIQVR